MNFLGIPQELSIKQTLQKDGNAFLFFFILPLQRRGLKKARKGHAKVPETEKAPGAMNTSLMMNVEAERA